MTSVAIINRSTVLTDDAVRVAVAALQKQVIKEFADSGWPQAEVAFLDPTAAINPGQWSLILLDDTDQAGALGYHDLPQAENGMPIGYVFAKTDAQYGLSWTVTASHELLEMLADPWIEKVALHQIGETGALLYSYEVCDACEDDALGYDINGVRVSDFVYPAWFQDWRPNGSTKFDHTGAIDAPFRLAGGGYISTFTPGTGWQQVSAPGRNARMAYRVMNAGFKRSHWRIK
jgi:hypothetical protein